MKETRRRLLGSMGLVLVAPALAQVQGRAARLGFLGTAYAAGYVREVEWIRSGLRAAGYVEGRNLTIEFRWAEGQDRLALMAQELVDWRADVIITHATPGATAAMHKTATIPIVMADGSDPVAAGLAASLARPGRNVTGSVSFVAEEVGKRLQLLRDVLPQLKSVAFLASSVDIILPAKRKVLDVAAQSMGLSTRQFIVRDAGQLAEAFNAIAAARVDGLVVNNEPLLNSQTREIASLALTARLPAVGYPSFADAGGLLAYGANREALYRRVGYFVDRILKGEKPGDLPFEQASKFDFIVNLGTARAMGVKIRQELLARADRVIE